MTPQQQAFFETFGYLVPPGLAGRRLGWITEEFEAVFRDRGVVHDGTKRSCIVPFIDQRERLCTLLDHPALEGLIGGLLGEDFNYLGGDGNYYAATRAGTATAFHRVGRFLKVALYLDPVGRETRAACASSPARTGSRPSRAGRRGGPAGRASCGESSRATCRAWRWSSRPGDVVAFNHNLMHASFGGSARRRMFTLNCCRRCETAEEIQDLERYISAHGRFWIDQLHSDMMRRTAFPARCATCAR